MSKFSGKMGKFSGKMGKFSVKVIRDSEAECGPIFMQSSAFVNIGPTHMYGQTITILAA